MTEVSVRELKARLPYYLRRSEEGERIVVTRRGKPIAQVGPLDGAPGAGRRLWEMVAEGRASWSGGKPLGDPHPPRLKGRGPSMSDMVLEDRR